MRVYVRVCVRLTDLLSFSFSKIGTTVYLRGLLRTGTGTLIATLPSTHRPLARHIFLQPVSGNGVWRVDVFPDGRVTTNGAAPTWLSLAGIQF